jgi:hypothetical protein
VLLSPRIAVLNPTVALPSAVIVVVYRTDGNGRQFVSPASRFVYLILYSCTMVCVQVASTAFSNASPQWKAKYGSMYAWSIQARPHLVAVKGQK